MKAIETRQLIKDYEIKTITVNALRGVDFSAESGEFTAIAGPSGSGKSTLLHLIGCLDTATQGKIYLDGKNVANLKINQLAKIRRKKIGFIFQAYNLIPVLTALENVSLPLSLLGYTQKEIKEKSYALLKAVGLEGMETRKPVELSGGQQQRVAIARSLVKNPTLVLADEPTANLDSKTGRDILNIMKKLNQINNTTFLFATHDPMVMKAANRVIHLHDGKIVEDKWN